MSQESGGFKPKPPEVLQKQVEKASVNLGTSIVPPSLEKSFLNKSEDELKKRFPNYYNVDRYPVN